MLWKYRKYIIGAFAVLSLVGAVLYYGHTEYSKGYERAMSEIVSAKDKANRQALEGANETRKKIQSLNDTELDNYLCDGIGIVWENSGCE